ncbi:MAG: ABC transporter permease subunit, partial [Proteobacteria bacterium]|nr:ABC transporter permease subunit [Pseudomonadota bacterium]
MRLRPILAIAMRDLRMELRGWRGLMFGAITAGLLMPAAAVPIRPQDAGVTLAEPQAPRVSGALPEGFQGEVEVVEKARTRLKTTEDGRTVVSGPVPPALRHGLDKLDPKPVTVQIRTAPLHLPGRTLLLALISSSVMMGALSESLAGERARRTLSTLLAAAVSKGEITVGKWLAWTGYGAGAACLSALIAILSGSVEPGAWLLPLPWVPATTVALGLYLVRRAKDVVAGATISLRVLPAVLMSAGIAAWMLGRIHPLLGSAVPLGGALLTAGSTWPGWAPPLVATLSTCLTTAFLLQRTAADLSDDPTRETARSPMAELVVMSSIAAAAWLAPILGPQLWALAGNATLTDSLSRPAGALAGGVGLTLLAGLRIARDADDYAWLRPSTSWWPALPAAAAVAAGVASRGLAPVPLRPALAAAQTRLGDALQPELLLPLVAVVIGQELVFRGFLQRAVGPWVALGAFVLTISPLDPLHGLGVGLPLAVLAMHTRSPL